MENAVAADTVLKDPDKIESLDTIQIDSILEKLFLDPNASIEKVNRAIAYKESVLSRQAKAAFDRALSACQAEMPKISKNKTATVRMKTGGSYTYNFAAFDEVLEVAKPILGKYALSFTCDVFPHEKKTGVTVIAGKLRHIGGHGESTEFEASSDSFSNSNNAQSLAGLETFARRYVFCRMLNIAPSDDNDNNGGGENKDFTIKDKGTPEPRNGAQPNSSGATNGQGSRTVQAGQSPAQNPSPGPNSGKAAPDRKEDEKRFREFSGTIQMALTKKDPLLLQTAVTIGASIGSEELKRKARSLYDDVQKSLKGQEGPSAVDGKGNSRAQNLA